MRSGNTYTSNGAGEMIKEIIANLKDEMDNIVFRMDSGYFSEEIAEVIEDAGYQYVVKAYVFVAGKIIKTARQTILKLLEGYPYKEVFL